MAEATGFRFFPQGKSRLTARRITARLIDRPIDVAALVEVNHKTLQCIFGFAEWPPTLSVCRPNDVPRSRAMASFTTYVDLGNSCGEAIGRRVIVLAHAGRMAFGAHVVPILVQLGPV